MSYASQLYRLQQIDTQIDQARNRLDEISGLLSADQAVQEAKAAFQQAETQLAEAHKSMSQVENQVQDQKFKIEQNESTLYSGKVRNPKELQDLQAEAEALKRYLVVLEDRLLEAMLATEEAEETFTAAQAALNAAVGQFSEQSAHLKAEQTQLQAELEHLNTERQLAESANPASDLERYHLLRQRRTGIAVARISDKSCSACGAALSPAVIQVAQSSQQLSTCPSCGRILFAS